MHPIIRLCRESAELWSTSTNIELTVSGSFPNLGHPLLCIGVCCVDINIHHLLFFYSVILFHVIIWKIIANMMSVNPCFR